MFYDTPLHMVEDATALRDLVDRLRGQPVIGVDTEADSFHHYKEKLCLIQVSDQEADFIIDPLKVPDISPIGELLEDPEQVVVLHGGDYDVVSLKRDYGIQIRNIFDTMIASQFLALPRIGLADLIGRFFGHQVDKKYQRHDWARRPLEPEHLDYARGDTHFLLALREVLVRRLEQVGRLEAHREECEILEQREWSGRGDDEADFLRTKKANTLDDDGKRVLRAVWQYRDDQARQMDRPVFKVIPDHVLIDLARRRPTDEEQLHKVMRKGSTMTRKHGDALLEAVKTGVADDSPLPELKKRRKSRDRKGRPNPDAPGVDQLLGPLKTWRNEVVDREGFAPVVVASNTLLKEIARCAPRDREQLEAVPGVRRWQVRAFGDQILEIIEEVEEARSGKKKRRRRRRKSTAEAAE